MEKGVVTVNQMRAMADEIDLPRSLRVYVPEVYAAALRHGAEALETLRQSSWQPIETAPKGRVVLVYYVNEDGHGRTVRAQYYLRHTLVMADDYDSQGDFDDASGIEYASEGWYEETENDSPLFPLPQEPTHWMPLPLAPTRE